MAITHNSSLATDSLKFKIDRISKAMESMESARQQWNILQQVHSFNKEVIDFTDWITTFMVIGEKGEGVVMATEPDGETFWYGKMKFGGETRQALEPTRLDVSKVIGMAHGRDHLLLLNRRGEIYAIGNNEYGQLGQGTVQKETNFSPQLIHSTHRFSEVRCGRDHSLALTEDGKVCAWGKNCFGQIGLPTSTSNVASLHQISVIDSHRVVSIECGWWHSLALTDQGMMFGWGYNQYGQLGSWPSSNVSPLFRLSFPIPIKSIAAGNYHSLFLTEDGLVHASGLNISGQIGQPTSNLASFETCQVSGLPPISQIASHHATDLSIAISTDRSCYVWGLLLGNSTPVPIKLPPTYSTLDSALSLYHPNTAHSISVSGCQLATDFTRVKLLASRLSRMFDNPETSDIQFVVENRVIHCHRPILRMTSLYFNRMFSETWCPTQPNPALDPIAISDHSYSAFYAYLFFLYTGIFKISTEYLIEMFELANCYLESDLQQLCLTRMLANLSVETCCQYYQLAKRHSLTEFNRKLIQFITPKLSEIIASSTYRSMDDTLCKQLAIEVCDL